MFAEGLIYTEAITMITVKCCECGTVFGMTSDLQKRFLNDHNKMFFCPNGHKQHYIGKTDAQKLKEAQEEMIKQRDARYREELAKNEALKKIRLLDAKIKRIHNGVCPCCNRSFENLRRHMETKHPEELKKFIELINQPRVEKTKLPPLKNEKGIIIINKLTQCEKRKLKNK